MEKNTRKRASLTARATSRSGCRSLKAAPRTCLYSCPCWLKGSTMHCGQKLEAPSASHMWALLHEQTYRYCPHGMPHRPTHLSSHVFATAWSTGPRPHTPPCSIPSPPPPPPHLCGHPLRVDHQRAVLVINALCPLPQGLSHLLVIQPGRPLHAGSSGSGSSRQLRGVSAARPAAGMGDGEGVAALVYGTGGPCRGQTVN